MQANNRLGAWLCPICKKALHLKVPDNDFASAALQGSGQKSVQTAARSAHCENEHVFDKAKAGYFNLLPVQHKNSQDPGDSKDMVRARQAFLASGAYAALADALANKVIELASKSLKAQDEALSLFDAGCSEGYYSRAIFKAFDKLGGKRSLHVSGIDIAKFAVEKAARQWRQSIPPSNHYVPYSVASSFDIPIQSDSQDFVLQIFAPSAPTEIARVLKNEGFWLLVEPNPSHLFELKEYVYEHAKSHEISASVAEGFELVSQESVNFKLRLESPEIREQLLMMTPFFWRISDERKTQMLNALSNVTADFRISVLKPLC